MISYTSAPQGSIGLVMEMTWRVMVITGDKGAMAQRIAKDLKATHYIHGLNERFTGSYQVAKDKKARKGDAVVPLYSLAYIAAKAYPNSAWLLEIPDSDYYWVCHCSEGSPVVGTDQVLSSDELQGHLESSAPFIESLQTKGGQFLCSKDFAGKTLAYTFADLESARTPQALLQPLKTGSFLFLRDIPRKYWIGAALAGFAIVTYRGYDYLHEQALLLKAKTESEESNQANDPELLFKKIYEPWRLAQIAPSHAGISAIQAKVLSLPRTVGSWSFKKIDCTAAALTPVEKGSVWSCSAMYFRDPYPTQSNIDFVRLAPADWTLSWTPLNEVIAKFIVPFTSVPITDEMMSTKKEHLLGTLSKIQMVDKAFTGIVFGGFAPIKLEEIKKTDGTVFVPSEEQVGKYAISEITMNAPLRSIDIVPIDDKGVSWRSFSVTANEVKPTLLASRLTVIAKGFIYAKN